MMTREEMKKIADAYHENKRIEKIAKTENWLKEEINYMRGQADIGIYHAWLKVPSDLDMNYVVAKLEELKYFYELFASRQIRVDWN
jgi:hypothetical protein